MIRKIYQPVDFHLTYKLTMYFQTTICNIVTKHTNMLTEEELKAQQILNQELLP